MTKRQKTVPTRRFYVAGFLAVLVIAIILISARYADPLVVKAIADLTVAYLAWRAAVQQRASDGGSGPARA